MRAIRDVIDSRSPLAAMLLDAFERDAEPDPEATRLLLSIEAAHEIVIVGPPFEAGDPILRGRPFDNDELLRAVRRAARVDAPATKPADSNVDWQRRLRAFLHDAPLLLAGEDFGNDHIVLGDGIPYGFTWRAWGEEVAAWLDHEADAPSEWNYLDFYMRSTVKLARYPAWADRVIALLRKASERIASALTHPLTFVAAIARNGVIGRAGGLPWDLPEDRAHFQRVTAGHAVIMGRRTWDETGAPLDGRRNIVISASGNVSGTGREVVATLDEAIARAKETDPEPIVIGGGEIFRMALPRATRMILTELDFDAEGDTRFPSFDRSEWTVTERRRGDRATYVTYER